MKAALAVLARRDASRERQPPKFDFAHTNLRGVRAEGIHLVGALLTGAHLENARLEGAQLRDAVLVEAHLEGAVFDGADLTRASLTKAHLTMAQLRNARGVEHATWQGAHYDRLSTTFPDGFKPEDHGAHAI